MCPKIFKNNLIKDKYNWKQSVSQMRFQYTLKGFVFIYIDIYLYILKQWYINKTYNKNLENKIMNNALAFIENSKNYNTCILITFHKIKKWETWCLMG